MLENQRLFSLVYEPITIKGITEANQELLDIYAEERRPRPKIEAVGKKVRGAALGAIYRVGNDATRWLGKNNTGTARLQGRGDAHHILREKDLSTSLEKLAYDIYKEWGRGLFAVPSSFLSQQPVSNPYTEDHYLAQELVNEDRIRACLHIFCRYVEGYQDFNDATTLDKENKQVNFVNFINNYHRPPGSIFSPAGELVPLLGMLELLAVMRAVGDIDGLGTGGNAGFVWKYNKDRRVIAAQTVKIDPGEAFRFREQDVDNAVMRTRLGLGTAVNRLSDCRDIQTSSQDAQMTIRWRKLEQTQKNVFLSTLLNCLRYKNNPGVLEFLVLRKDKFIGQVPREVGEGLIADLTRWLKIQEKVYKIDLDRFQEAYPEELLRIQYIDRYGELPLPASDKIYPIRELYANLTLVEQKKQRQEGERSEANERNPNLPERDSLYDLFSSPPAETFLELSHLFQPTAHENKEIRKVLVVGAAGIGKSTLCQKIAHDWATEKLWSQYKAIYWLPLRKCNGETFHTQNPQKWLVQCLAKLVVEREFLETSLEKQLDKSKKEILILLDGYDEASPDVANRVKKLLELPDLNILLTSRPGAFTAHGRIDRIVETRGFSEAQSLQYAQRFFERDEPDPLEAQRQFNDFLQALRANTICSKIARIPLQLQMLCVLWERYRAADGLPADLTTLYQHMVLELFSWHCQPTRGGEDLRAAKEPAFALLGEIGLSGLQSGQLLIAGTAIERTGQQNLLLATGLLKKNESGQYYFLHLTFQEYLTAQFISDRPQEEQKQFVLLHRNLPQFQLVIGFLAGLLSQRLCSEEMREFFGWLHQPGADLIGIHQSSLTLRCLNECADPDLHQWVERTYGLKKAFLHLIDHEINQANGNIPSWLIHLCQAHPLGSASIVQSAVVRLDELMKAKPLSYLSLSAARNLAAFRLHGWDAELLPIVLSAIKSEHNDLAIQGEHILREIIESVPNDQIAAIFVQLKQAFAGPLVDRAYLAEALGKVAAKGTPAQIIEAMPILLQAAQSDGAKRLGAIQAIGGLAHALANASLLEALSLLESTSTHLALEVRRASVQALGKALEVLPISASATLLPLLKQALQDQDPYTRECAVRALGQAAALSTHSYEEVYPCIRQALTDVFPPVRERAYEAAKLWIETTAELQNLSFFPAVKQVAEDREKAVRVQALSAAGVLAAVMPMDQLPGLLEVLRVFLKDRDGAVRQEATQSISLLLRRLSAAERPAVLEPVWQILPDRETAFCEQVVQLVKEWGDGMLEQKVPLLVQELIEKLANGRTTLDVGEAAITTLGALAAVASAGQLTEILAAWCKALQERPPLVNRLLVTLPKLAKEASAEQVKSIVEVLWLALQPGSRQTRNILMALAELTPLVPAAEIPRILLATQSLANNKQNLRLILEKIPIESYLQCLQEVNPSLPSGCEGSNPVHLILEQAVRRKIPLYLERTPAGYSLCATENNQKYQHVISQEQLQACTSWSSKSGLLTCYTTTYYQEPSLSL